MKYLITLLLPFQLFAQRVVVEWRATDTQTGLPVTAGWERENQLADGNLSGIFVPVYAKWVSDQPLYVERSAVGNKAAFHIAVYDTPDDTLERSPDYVDFIEIGTGNRLRARLDRDVIFGDRYRMFLIQDGVELNRGLVNNRNWTQVSTAFSPRHNPNSDYSGVAPEDFVVDFSKRGRRNQNRGREGGRGR